MSQFSMLDKKQCTKIIQEHLNSITTLFRQIAAQNIKEMKMLSSEKHWHYEQKLHEQFIEKSITKTMQKIQCFLTDILLGQDAGSYRQEMSLNKNEQMNRILRIKALAQKISHIIRQEQIQKFQEEIKVKLHQFKPNQFNYIPRVREQQHQNDGCRLIKLQKRLNFYEQKYNKNSSEYQQTMKKDKSLQ